MEHDLVNLYLTEGLCLIGGIQEKNRANSIQMLFYRVDVNNPGIKKAIVYEPAV